jgi:hypothetical protein
LTPRTTHWAKRSPRLTASLPTRPRTRSPPCARRWRKPASRWVWPARSTPPAPPKHGRCWPRSARSLPCLGAFGWGLDLAQITPFARWFPKNERIPRVYDTRFYLANLGTGAVEVSIDHAENTQLFWTSATGALEAAERGEIKLIFPTRRNLERLALFGSYEEARAQAEAIPVRTIMPQIVEEGGKAWLTILGDAGYPVTAELLENVARG